MTARFILMAWLLLVTAAKAHSSTNSSSCEYPTSQQKFDCLKLETRIVIYAVILMVVACLVILSTGCVIYCCYRLKRENISSMESLDLIDMSVINPGGDAIENNNYGSTRQCGDPSTPPDLIFSASATSAPSAMIVYKKKIPTDSKSIPEEYLAGHHTNRDADTSAGLSLSLDMAITSLHL